MANVPSRTSPSTTPAGPTSGIRRPRLRLFAALVACMFVALAGLTSTSPQARADDGSGIGIGDPGDPTGSGSTVPPAGGGGTSTNFVCVAYHGVVVGGTYNGSNHFTPRYIPYPPCQNTDGTLNTAGRTVKKTNLIMMDGSLTTGYDGNKATRWLFGSATYRDCSLYWEVWRFTGTVDNPTQLVTVSDVVQPDPCESRWSTDAPVGERTAVVVTPNPDDVNPSTYTNPDIRLQPTASSQAASWSELTQYSAEVGRGSSITQTGTWTPGSGLAGSIGTTPPFRVYKGSSSAGYNTSTHLTQLTTAGPNDFAGRTATVEFMVALEQLGFKPSVAASAADVPANPDFTSVDGIASSSLYDYYSNPDDELNGSSSRTVTGACFTPVRSRMLRFVPYTATGEWDNRWAVTTWDPTYRYYYANGGGRNTVGDSRFTPATSTTFFDQYRATIAAELASRTSTPTAGPAVMGEGWITNEASADEFANCFIGSGFTASSGGCPAAGCPTTKVVCCVAPSKPEVPSVGAVSLTVNSFLAGQSGAAMTAPQVITTAYNSDLTCPSGASPPCGPVPWSVPTPTGEQMRTVPMPSGAYGPFLYDGSAPLQITAPAGYPQGSAWSVTSSANQDPTKGAVTSTVTFNRPTGPGATFNIQVPSPTVRVYWIAWYYTEILGACPSGYQPRPGESSCVVGWSPTYDIVWQNAGVNVHYVPDSNGAAPGHDFTVIGATVKG